jgi:hypothetical protein
MRKSSDVPLNLLAALAKFVTGRGDAPETCYCVDEQRRIVPEINCQSSSLGTTYHYIYGGSSSGQIGDTVVGGSTLPSNEGEVIRGGFGYSGGGEGAGG